MTEKISKNLEECPPEFEPSSDDNVKSAPATPLVPPKPLAEGDEVKELETAAFPHDFDRSKKRVAEAVLASLC